jgi:hypothetical protein
LQCEISCLASREVRVRRLLRTRSGTPALCPLIPTSPSAVIALLFNRRTGADQWLGQSIKKVVSFLAEPRTAARTKVIERLRSGKHAEGKPDDRAAFARDDLRHRASLDRTKRLV